MSQRAGRWRRSYPRPAGAAAIGTAAVPWVRGSRERQREARARALGQQAERHARTGFVGGSPELGNLVRFELRRLKYSPAIADFGAHLCAVGGTWNFQGNPRLAQLVGRSLRSAQRYRAQLEADGLLRSYCLSPGDMVDGQRAPVSRPQVVRDLTNLRALALARLATKPSPPHRRTKAQARAAARAAAVAAPPRPEPAPLSYEQLLELAQRPGAASWVGDAILGRSERGRGVVKSSPLYDPPPPPEFSDSELDAIDAELRALTEERERERERPPDRPPD